MNWKSIFSNFVGVKSQQISDNHARMRPLAILLRFMAPHRKLLIYSPNYWFWALWLLIFCSGGWQLCLLLIKKFCLVLENMGHWIMRNHMEKENIFFMFFLVTVLFFLYCVLRTSTHPRRSIHWEASISAGWSGEILKSKEFAECSKEFKTTLR